MIVMHQFLQNLLRLNFTLNFFEMIIVHKKPNKMKKKIDFNHIDPTIDEETKEELKKLYKYCHKLWWCHKKTVERLKKINLVVNLVSVSLVTAGTIAGATTANPIILGVITGAGLLIKTASEVKQVTNKL